MFWTGLLYAIKSLGLRFLSLAFYHGTLDEQINATIENHGTFIDVVKLLAPKFYVFEGVEEIEWRSSDATLWLDLSRKVDDENREAYSCKLILVYYLVLQVFDEC